MCIVFSVTFDELSTKLKRGDMLIAARHEDEKLKGVIRYHAYTMTGMSRVLNMSKEEVLLLRLLNSWGHNEWEGSWSDK